MDANELCFLSLADVSRLISSRELSPVSLVRTVLDRTAQLDGTLGTYVTVLAESALEAASEAERAIANGNYRGPLHGVPISLKDIIYVKGVRNTGSSRVLADFVPDHEPYEHLTLVDIEPSGDRTKVTMTVDPMHDVEWTGRLVAGRNNELDNLAKVLESGAEV